MATTTVNAPFYALHRHVPSPPCLFFKAPEPHFYIQGSDIEFFPTMFRIQDSSRAFRSFLTRLFFVQLLNYKLYSYCPIYFAPRDPTSGNLASPPFLLTFLAPLFRIKLVTRLRQTKPLLLYSLG